jgi:dipeptidase E
VLGCPCKTIERGSLTQLNDESIDNLIDWADIIYESGGDTKRLIDLWRSTRFDSTLRNAWENGKVLCGISAGACCWFDACGSDSLKKQLNDPTAPMMTVECLGFIHAYFTPHFNVVNEYTNRPQYMKDALKTRELVGIGLSNCAALEMVDDTYRLLTTDATNYNIQAFGMKTYYKDGQYIEETIDQTNEWMPSEPLFTK